MERELFRKKSMERASSPEQLTDYIRVSNPGVWMVLMAIVVLLAGVCVWGIFGRMETKLAVAAVSEGGEAVCYVKESDIASVREGMTVRCADGEYMITGIAQTPIMAGGNIDEYALHVGSLSSDEWVYRVTLDGGLADGVFLAEIIVDSVSPISFVVN